MASGRLMDRELVGAKCYLVQGKTMEKARGLGAGLDDDAPFHVFIANNTVRITQGDNVLRWLTEKATTPEGQKKTTYKYRGESLAAGIPDNQQWWNLRSSTLFPGGFFLIMPPTFKTDTAAHDKRCNGLRQKEVFHPIEEVLFVPSKVYEGFTADAKQNMDLMYESEKLSEFNKQLKDSIKLFKAQSGADGGSQTGLPSAKEIQGRWRSYFVDSDMPRKLHALSGQVGGPEKLCGMLWAFFSDAQKAADAHVQKRMAALAALLGGNKPDKLMNHLREFYPGSAHTAQLAQDLRSNTPSLGPLAQLSFDLLTLAELLLLFALSEPKITFDLSNPAPMPYNHHTIVMAGNPAGNVTPIIPGLCINNIVNINGAPLFLGNN